MTNTNEKVKRTSKLFLLFAFAITFSFAACGGDDDDKKPTIPTGPFPGLKVGYEWTFEETEYDADGNTTDTDTRTFHIVEKRTEGAGDVYVALRNNTDSVNGGMYNKQENAIFANSSVPLMFGNCFVGQIGNNDRSIVESVSELTIVPAGGFYCVKIKTIRTFTLPGAFSTTTEEFGYISKTYGLIKHEEIIKHTDVGQPTKETRIVSVLKSKNFLN